MPYKVLCNGLQTLLRGQQVDLFGKLPFQLFLLIDIQVDPLDGVQNPVGDLRVVQVCDLLPPVFVI